MTLLMQEHDDYKKLTHQNLIDYEILHPVVEEYYNCMNLGKNYFVFSWMLSNPEFALEMEKLISKNKLSLEYAKSVQYALSWLIEMYDVKCRQLHDNLDYISRWRLLNLLRQAEFILDNLVVNDQRQDKKTKDKYGLEDGSDVIPNIEEIEFEETILTKQNEENLNETNKTEIKKNKSQENISSDYITSTEETQVTKRIKDIRDKNLATAKDPSSQQFNVSTDDNSTNNSTFFSKMKTLEDKNVIKNETSRKKKYINSPHDNYVKEQGKRFSQLKNVSSISPSENSTGTLRKTDHLNPVGTDATSGFSKNITNNLNTRRTLGIFVPLNKEKYNKKKNKHVSSENKYNYFNKRTEIKSDNASAMDEILEAVAEVLKPTVKSVERPSKGTKVEVSRIS